MANIDKIVNDFKTKFLSMSYEEREAYLKKYGFSFEEEGPISHIRYLVRHVSSPPKTVSVVSTLGLKVASRPNMQKRTISKKKAAKAPSKFDRMVKISIPKNSTNDD